MPRILRQPFRVLAAIGLAEWLMLKEIGDEADIIQEFTFFWWSSEGSQVGAV
jgi:hypothetical protein